MINKKLVILGSTGSIGIQTLEVARKLNIEIVSLIADKNVDVLEQQIVEFRPMLCAMFSEQSAVELKRRLSDKKIKCEILSGKEGINTCAQVAYANTCVSAITGIAGLEPTIKAIQSGKDIALANKETLVVAGELVKAMAKYKNVEIFPIDSEHSAIFQCLSGNNKKDVEKIILTASGGPFRDFCYDALKNVKASDALCHPTWNMGNKITIDSATLMNKGLEVIEAHWLFDMPVNKIKPIIHPESIIHSMVEYKDGSVIAQMGTPDMRLPISLALTWPERSDFNFSKLDLIKCSKLTFREPDIINFRCLTLAFEAIKAGGVMPAVLNGANEICVDLFLRGRIEFLQIAEFIERAMEKYFSKNQNWKEVKDINDVICADKTAREYVIGMAGGN